MIGQYYQLTKPGIIRGNLLTATAGFMLASRGDVDLWLLLATLAGTSLVIACGCIINNYLDRGLDTKMTRTKQRALVTGAISSQNALLFASLLGVLGTVLLAMTVNILTAVIGLLGLFSYVVLYGVAKRRTVYGTLVGSISGAIPPVAGYTAVTNQLDGAALLLFLIIVCWQMPHFYAIAIYRLKDYQAAGLPVWPDVKGVPSTARQMLLYIVAFTLTASMLTVFGYTSLIYLLLMLVIGVGWISFWFADGRSAPAVSWARKMFFVSLLVMTAWSLVLTVDSFFV